MFGMALPHLHSCGVLWLLKVKHPTATMPLRIPVNFPHSSAYLIKIKVHNTRPWHLHYHYRISGGPCVPSFSLPDTLGRSCLNSKDSCQDLSLLHPATSARLLPSSHRITAPREAAPPFQPGVTGGVSPAAAEATALL